MFILVVMGVSLGVCNFEGGERAEASGPKFRSNPVVRVRSVYPAPGCQPARPNSRRVKRGRVLSVSVYRVLFFVRFVWRTVDHSAQFVARTSLPNFLRLFASVAAGIHIRALRGG